MLVAGAWDNETAHSPATPCWAADRVLAPHLRGLDWVSRHQTLSKWVLSGAARQRLAKTLGPDELLYKRHNGRRLLSPFLVP